MFYKLQVFNTVACLLTGHFFFQLQINLSFRIGLHKYEFEILLNSGFKFRSETNLNFEFQPKNTLDIF
jgi:hypothetical protein